MKGEASPQRGAGWLPERRDGRLLVRTLPVVQVHAAPRASADRSESTGDQDDGKGPHALVCERGLTRQSRRARRVRHEHAGGGLTRKLIIGRRRRARMRRHPAEYEE